MRPDMKKVIVSRPRRGSGDKRKDWCRYDEDAPSRERMKAHNYENKDQTDLLGPLRKFLRTRLGRRWDDVWSEVCAHADARSLMGEHLRRHVDQYVDQLRLGPDGVLYDKYGYPFKTESHWDYKQYYVDPRDGVLKAVTYVPWPKREKIELVLELNGQQYHKHDGIWYRVQMREIPAKRWHDQWPPQINDSFLGRFYTPRGDWYGWGLRRKLEAEYGFSPTGQYWFCVWKQSANHREIKKLRTKYSDHNYFLAV